MKSTMNMFVWGVLFFILGTIILWVVFGLVIAKFFSVLAIVFVIAGLKNMKLFYILPFTANRITVIDVKSGQCMYDLMWSPTPINKILLAGLIKGLNQITNQIFSQRHIREVKLDNGVLLLHHCNHISVGLLVSRSSNYLKLCLAKFSQEFDQTFYADNPLFNDDLRRFSNASKLILKYFGNIPTRISERQFLS